MNYGDTFTVETICVDPPEKPAFSGQLFPLGACTHPGAQPYSSISGQETITDLAVGTATEITVDHSAAALFETCEYPRVVAPYGVRVTVLASGIGADSTSEGQFVLLVENVSYVTDGGYGTSAPDVVLDWTRTGVV